MWRLLSKLNLYTSITSSDPLWMATMSGKRDVGLWIIQEIMTHCPNMYSIMQQEAYGREQREDPGNTDY